MATTGSWALSVLWAGSCLFLAASAQKYCYADNPNPFFNYGTKTAYEVVYNKKGIVTPPDCKPVQMWLMCRHGTRWPGADDIPSFVDLKGLREQVITNYNKGTSNLCKKDIENLKKWSFHMLPEQGDQLTQQGYEDLYYLGKRLRKYFPDLLTTFDPEKFLIRHTNTPRTRESAEYFVRGAFGLGKNYSLPAIHGALSGDHLIYTYKDCPNWSKLSPLAKKEKSKFIKTDWMAGVLNSVSTRLGYNYNLTFDHVKSIYDGCRFQKAWEVYKLSPWCAAFSREDIETLEYGEDLNYYYKSGPAMPMSIRLGCPLKKDLYNRFSAVEANPEGKHPLGMFYFSHVSMVDIASAALELTHDDPPITADNYDKQQHRQFRTSQIIPFSANILAVLYSCPNGYQTVFYQTESTVKYPGCYEGLCKWNFIKDKFRPVVTDKACTDTSYCYDSLPQPAKAGKPQPVDSSARLPPSPSALLPLLLASLLYYGSRAW